MTEIGVLVLLSLSPFIGYVLGRSAQEELKPGMKWFLLSKRVLFTAAIAVFLYAHKWMLWPMVIGLTALFAYLAFKPFRIWWLVQAELAIAFALTARTPLAFLATAAVFLYGLPTGTALAQKNKTGLLKALLAGAVFFVVALSAVYLL